MASPAAVDRSAAHRQQPVDRLVSILIAAAALLLMAAGPALAEPVRVGVLAFRGPEQAIKRWTATTDYLTRTIPGHDFELVPLSLEGVQTAVRDRSIDFLLTNPGNYVQLAPRLGLGKVATLKTDGLNGVPTGNRFGAVIFVRADRGDVTALSDLKGKTLAAVSPEAFGGFQLAWQELKDQRIDPFHDLEAVKFMGFPQDAILWAVLDRKVDAGTFRTGVLESLARDGRFDLSQIKILNARKEPGFGFLLSTRLYPEWVFAAVPGTPLALREQVALALLAIPADAEAARKGGYTGWTTPLSDRSIVELFRNIGVLPATTPDMPLLWLLVAAAGGLVAGIVLHMVWLRVRRRGLGAPTGDARAPGLAAKLTPREREVLALLVAGESNKRIAHQLDISDKTVEFHRANIMKKLEVHNTATLVRTALEAGIAPISGLPQGNP